MQQSISLCSLSSRRLGFLDLSVAELVEGSNKLLWWALLDNGTHFVCQTYRRESGKRPWARKHDINYEPFHCWAASLWEEPICDHARVCCSALHGIQRHGTSWHQRELLALHVDILGLDFGIVSMLEGSSQRSHCKDARPYSTGAIQARSVVTCRPVHRARCRRQKVAVAIIDLDINRGGHECTDIFTWAMMRID